MICWIPLPIGRASVSASASPKTIFNDTLADAFETLKTGASDLLSQRRLQKKIDDLVSVDASGAWELRGYVAAIANEFQDADDNFARALRILPNDPNIIVRWLAMLCVTGQVEKVKAKFGEYRHTLEGNLSAMRAVTSLLGYVGLLHDAYVLREELLSIGSEVPEDDFQGDLGIASAQVVGEVIPSDLFQFEESLPCSHYAVNADDATVLLAAHGLEGDAWSEPVGCAIKFLREKRMKVIAVKSSFVPHDNLPATVHVQILVATTPSVCADAEWDYYGRLATENFAAVSSGAASLAFLPTLAEAADANIA